MVSDIYRNVMKTGEGTGSQHWSVSVTDLVFAVKALTLYLGSKKVGNLNKQ